MTTIKSVRPSEIEARSFAIIEKEFEDQTGLQSSQIDPDCFQVIRRVIHATGDFDFGHSLIFGNRPIEAAMESIRSGRDIYIDVSMGAAGISAKIINQFGGRVKCHINDADISAIAKNEGKTRTETALEKLSGSDVGIIAVGNAPTALVAAMTLIKEGKIDPALVVGVPVGFVNAVESKKILTDQSYPFITNMGRKGGTPVAVAIVNAFLRLATQVESKD
ncbi:MAG: precorrin-8X methylmutase [Desulfobulbaceae bacterium]|nr:MAG: precorrin-8X methylmutase [Desulfobulbaceae bacterium]